ncbi:diguanylate cyclase [bacterium]|nr:diguanylate cyclase [bacterium]MBU1883648.1 diguanylate cyclase [bacterium]
MEKHRHNSIIYKKLQRAPYQLIFIMSMILALVTIVSIYGLYKIGFEQQRKRLSELVKNEVVMINMLIDYQIKMDHNTTIDKAKLESEILQKLIYAHARFTGFGESGEFTMAKLDNNRIHFLLRHRHNEVDRMDSITTDSELAAPMRAALSDKSGSLVGLDYRGAKVLSAYEPIPILDWGIVAKMDIAEIEAPYVDAGIYGLIGSIILIMISSFTVIRFTEPLLNEIEKSRKYNRMLFDESPIGLVLTDMKGRMIDVNPSFARLIGYSLEEISNMTYWDITPNKYKSQEYEQLNKLATTGNYGPYEKEYIHKEGHHVNVRLSGCMLHSDNKSFIWSSVEDITEHKRSEMALKESSLVFENTHEGIMITDADAKIRRVNNTFTKITGYLPEEAIGKNPSFLQSKSHTRDFYQEMWNTINTRGTWYGELNNRRKNGEYFTTMQSITAVKDEEGFISGYVSVFSDISERKNHELRLAHLASHDTLTSLPNRMHFYDNLDKAILIANRRKSKIAVLFIDLNKFKEVNDNLGHNIGDRLLIDVANRLVKSIRGEDTASRLGGDEFAVILTELKEYNDAVHIVEKIIHRVEQPLCINDNLLTPSLSIGISIYPEDGEDGNTLVGNADKAMYTAKHEKHEKYALYKDLI